MIIITIKKSIVNPSDLFVASASSFTLISDFNTSETDDPASNIQELNALDSLRCVTSRKVILEQPCFSRLSCFATILFEQHCV